MTAENAWPYPVSEFKCHSCGNCCRGEGYVELDNDTIDAIAQFLTLSRDDFLEQFATYDAKTRRWHLNDQADEEKSCIFLLPDNRCQVHPVKPQQCRDFPRKWRPSNIADFCEGWRAGLGLPPAAKRTMS